LNHQHFAAVCDRKLHLLALLVHDAIDKNSDMFTDVALVVKHIVTQARLGGKGLRQNSRQGTGRHILWRAGFVTLQGGCKFDQDHGKTIALYCGLQQEEKRVMFYSILSRSIAVILVFFSLGVQAVELKVLSGNGSRPATIALVAQFERATGHKVQLDFYVNPEVKKRIESGETFDVTVLNPPILDALIKSGHVVANSRAVIGRIGLGAAIKAGAPRPDISTPEAFKKALLSVNSVAYPGDGASGIYFANLVQRMGIGEQMKPKMRPMPGEYNVEMVAKGEADMIVVVASRMYGVPGVDSLGLIPKELQTWIGFATGVSSKTQHAEAARALTKFLSTPPADQVLRPIGIEPFVE
jgi:molybdate transport system substrate-binding protein